MTLGAIYVLAACFLAGIAVIVTLYARLLFGKRDLLSLCSVALGEVGVKSRVKRVTGYKKPVLWVVIVCLLLCVLVAVLFLTDPKGEEETPSDAESSVGQVMESTTPPYAYFHSFPKGYSHYDLEELIEILGSDSLYEDPKYKGKQIPFLLYDAGGEKLTYFETRVNPYEEHGVLVYNSEDQRKQFLLDEETGEIRSIWFLSFPEGYEVKRKTEIDLDDAKEYCRQFIETFYPKLSLDEYELTKTSTMAMHLTYEKFRNGIQVDSWDFTLDRYGNIELVTRDACQNEVLPSYTDAQYITAARERLEPFYADKTDVAELKDFELQYKKDIYLRDKDCYAIEYGVGYTVAFRDGRELPFECIFYLPYGSDGNAIRIKTDREDQIKTYGEFTYETYLGYTTIVSYSGNDTHVTVPSVIDGYPVTVIGEGVFADRSEIVSVNLPETISEIGARAFANCTSLQTVDVKNGLWEIGENAFSRCTSLAEFTFPTTLSRIGNGAFYGTALREIIMPKDLVTIDDAAFRQCLELEFIMFSEGLGRIGDFAFAETAITEIVIPTVSSINESAFYNCKELKKVTFEGNEISNYHYPDSDSWERNYTIYFYEDKGFSEPYWNGYKTEMIADESKCDIVRNYEPSNLAELTFIKLPMNKKVGNAIEDTSVLYAADGENTVLYLPDEEEYILLYGSSPRFAESCGMHSWGNLLLFEPFDDGNGKCGRIRVTYSISGRDRADVEWITLPRAVELTALYYSSNGAKNYLFVFDANGLAYLVADKGNGEGYQSISIAPGPECESGELPVLVNMFGVRDEGWVYFAPDSDARPVGERLFLTLDSGDTWFLPKGDAQTEALLATLIEVESLVYRNAKYILTVKETENAPSPGGTHRFVSEDLTTWTYEAAEPINAVVYDDCVNAPLLYLPHIQSSEVPRAFVTAMQNDPLTMDFDAEANKSAVLESKYIPLWNAELEHTAAAILAKVGEDNNVDFASYREAFLDSTQKELETEKSLLGVTGEKLAYRTFDAYRQLTYRLKWMLYLIETADGGAADVSVRFLYRNTHAGAPKNLLLLTASDRFAVWELYKTQDGTDGLSEYARAMIYNSLDADPDTDTSDRRNAAQDAIETFIALAGNDAMHPIYAWEGAQNSVLKWEHNAFATLCVLGCLDTKAVSWDDNQVRFMREKLFRIKYWTYLYETEVLGNDAELSLQF